MKNCLSNVTGELSAIRSASCSVVIAAAVSLLGCHVKSAEATAIQPAAASTKTATRTANLASSDGPFGLAAGTSIAELERLGFKSVQGNPGIYEGVPPKPIEGVSEYALIATPKAGLCRVQSRAIVSNVKGTGAQLRAEVDRLAGLMGIRYGKHSLKGDINDRDATKRNPQLWMLGLMDESVLYGYTWNSHRTIRPLPNRIDFIEVTAGAFAVDRGYVSMMYTFNNYDACRKENQARAASNL